MTCNFLLLNSDKTEVLVLGTKTSKSKMADYVLNLDSFSLNLDASSAATSSAVKNLGVVFDQNLSFNTHIKNISRVAFFHLRNIAKLRKMMSLHDAEKFVHAFITSRLDYCNALLSGCTNASLNSLQMVQNAAARVLTRTKKYEHITPVLSSLHWLPIEQRIDYKVLLLTFKALNGLAPQYMSDLITTYTPSRSLRSQNTGTLVVPRIDKITAGGRAFSYRAPLLWNKLPINIRTSDTVTIFKLGLKHTSLIRLTKIYMCMMHIYI